MTREETLKFLAIVKVAYPMAYKDMDKDSKLATVNMWQATFSDVPYAVMSMALDHFRKVSTFPPTVADMYRELRDLYYTAIGKAMSAVEQKGKEQYCLLMEYTERFRGDYIDHEISLKSLNELPSISDYQKSLPGGGQDDGEV